MSAVFPLGEEENDCRAGHAEADPDADRGECCRSNGYQNCGDQDETARL
jgi:hypothetical protein